MRLIVLILLGIVVSGCGKTDAEKAIERETKQKEELKKKQYQEAIARENAKLKTSDKEHKADKLRRDAIEKAKRSKVAGTYSFVVNRQTKENEIARFNLDGTGTLVKNEIVQTNFTWELKNNEVWIISGNGGTIVFRIQSNGDLLSIGEISATGKRTSQTRSQQTYLRKRVF